jgi:membrane-associated phospholipid phosphatase
MRVAPVVLFIYILSTVAGFLFLNMRLTVEWVAIILFGAAVLSVFVFVLLAWQLASPLATSFSFPTHLQELVHVDKVMFFGTLPTTYLQQHLYRPGKIGPLDIFATVMYMLHFLTPLVAGFVIWMTDRTLFRKFAISFVLVAVAGFITYVLYPAVPPWMAAHHLIYTHNHYTIPYAYSQGHWIEDVTRGNVYLPGVRNLFNVTASHWYNPYHGTIVFSFLHLHYDNVAAMPSEHAMYPMLFFLFLRRKFGRPAYLVLVYIACMLFSIVYLGQHYVIDAVIGFAYAILGYLFVMNVFPALVARWKSMVMRLGFRFVDEFTLVRSEAKAGND